MKILAINGSPRGAQGNTEVILQAFLKGAGEAGAENDTLYLKDYKINHCLGCFSCWMKTPGVCVHKDDMPELFRKFIGMDLMVYAMPLYIYTVPGLMKDFLDRLIPLVQPHIEKRGDHFLHPPRYGAGLRRSVLISNAGFSEVHHFAGLKETFRLLTDGPDSKLCGMICCAAGPLLSVPDIKDSVKWYLDAAEKAGREVVESGSISPAVQEILDRSLAPDPEAYASIVNAFWEGQGVVRFEPGKEFREGESAINPDQKSPLPPPESLETVRDLIAGMPLAFKADEAGDLEAVIQFDITDEDPGRYYLEISGGKCRAFEGDFPQPTATILTPADIWLKIGKGELSGAAAYMTGKYKVKGSLGLLMKLSKIFAPPK